MDLQNIKINYDLQNTKINYEIVCRAGDYQTIRLGGEWTAAPGTDETAAYMELDRRLRSAAESVLAARQPEAAPQREIKPVTAPQSAPTAEKVQLNVQLPEIPANRQKVAKNSGTWDKIMARLKADTVRVDKILYYYDPDPAAMADLVMYDPHATKKQRLEFGDELQAVCVMIENGEFTLAQVLERYEPTPKARKVLNIDAALQGDDKALAAVKKMKETATIKKETENDNNKND